MADLLRGNAMKKSKDDSYTAKDIEVLEGLEPVRRRPGMYIGGTDEVAMHHLVAEALDNAMDEAVAGHASRIEVELGADNVVTIRAATTAAAFLSANTPNSRARQRSKSFSRRCIRVVNFPNKVYQTSGGLHGVGISVVNALSEELTVEIALDKELYTQSYSRGAPQVRKLKKVGPVNRRGTTVIFKPDVDIFGSKAKFKPNTLFRLARSKAYLFSGVEIRWKCDPALIKGDDKTPAEAVLHFPGGLTDFLKGELEDRDTLTKEAFSGSTDLPDKQGKVEWAVAWPDDGEGFSHSYCNTIPTPQGGTHESGMRSALLRGLRAYGEMIGNRRATAITGDEAFGDAAVLLSLFIRNPQFQGQTKDKLANPEAFRLVDQVIKDHFDHWLVADSAGSKALLDQLIFRAEERARLNQAKDLARKSATRKLRLPGKLADCSQSNAAGTEIFLVEGDSAGGSAKQARKRETQAILPLRGKILNVASATSDKLRGNQELMDLTQALGCGVGADFNIDKLRYETRRHYDRCRDVDGAHIAALLMTFFYREMPGLDRWRQAVFSPAPALWNARRATKLVMPATRRIGTELLKTEFTGRGNVVINRFKGLGEMESNGAPRKPPWTFAQARSAPCPGHRTGRQGCDAGHQGHRKTGRKPDGPQTGTALSVHSGKTQKFVRDVDV